MPTRCRHPSTAGSPKPLTTVDIQEAKALLEDPMSGLCEASGVNPYTAHDIGVVCEEEHDGDPATVATAGCPRAGNA